MARRFDTTSWSLVLQTRARDSATAHRALGTLCEAYWYPLYGFVRHQGYSADEAADLVQGFFAVLLEKHYLDDADPGVGRFRSFLLASLKHFLSNERDKERALKRGGDVRKVSLDADEAEGRFRLEPADRRDPEHIFERRWAFTVVDRVLETLREERTKAGKGDEFSHLKGYINGEEPHVSYRAAAAQLGTSEGAIKVAVHRLRSRFGALLREEIEQTVVDPGHVDDEIRHLLEVIGGRAAPESLG